MKELTLFEIGEDFKALYNLLADTEGDISDEEVERTIEEWFNEINVNQNKKINGYCQIIKNLEGVARLREDEANRLLKSRLVLKNKVAKMKERLLLYFTTQGIDKVVTDLNTVTVVKNGGQAALAYPELWDTDPASAPERFHKKVIQIDTASIRQALEEQEATKRDNPNSELDPDLSGCYIKDRGKHIRIK